MRQLVLKLYSTHYYPELLEKFSIEGFLLPIKKFSDHSDVLYDIEAIEDLVLKIQSQNKHIFAWLNRFMFEDEIDDFRALLNSLKSLGFNGIAYLDLGISKLMDELNLDLEKIYISDPSITNSQDYRIVAKFNSKVLLSRELTQEELLEIGANHGDTALVSIYGHQLMSISRRPLLSSYGEFVNIDVERHKIYRLKEQKREEPYYLFEDETSTSIFDGRVLIDFEGIQAFKNVGMKHFLVEGFNRPKQEFLNTIELLEAIYQETMTIEEALNQFNQSYPEVVLTEGLRKTKTSDRKVEV